MRLGRWVERLDGPLARRGWQLTKTDAWRRVQLLAAHDVTEVLDVGAARGEYVHSLRVAGFHGRVVSFEPLAEPFADLADAAAHDSLWTPVNLALGASDGEVTMHIAGNSDSSSMLPMLERHSRSAPEADYVGSEVVRQTTLDRWLEEHPESWSGPAGTLLKLDCQGYEGQVLDGAQRLLAEVAAVQIEMSLVPLYEGALGLTETIERMRQAGLTPVLLEPVWRDAETQQLLQADGVFLRLGGER